MELVNNGWRWSNEFEVFAIILTFIICLAIIDDIDDGIR